MTSFRCLVEGGGGRDCEDGIEVEHDMLTGIMKTEWAQLSSEKNSFQSLRAGPSELSICSFSRTVLDLMRIIPVSLSLV